MEIEKKKNLKNVITILILLILVIGISIIVLWKTGVIFASKDEKINPSKNPTTNDIDTTKHVNIIKNDYRYITKSDDGIYKDIDTKKEIFNPKEKYVSDEYYLEPIVFPEKKENIPNYLAQYSGAVSLIYEQETADKFDNDIVAAVVALSSELYQPRTEDDIKKTVKRYFDIDNYELPTGTYILKNYGKFTVAKENGYYFMSEIKDKIKHDKTVYTTNAQIDNDKIILYLDEANDSFLGTTPGCYTPIEPKEECTSGYYKIYFTKKSDEVMTVDKIEYSKNPNYVEKWITEE